MKLFSRNSFRAAMKFQYAQKKKKEKKEKEKGNA